MEIQGHGRDPSSVVRRTRQAASASSDRATGARPARAPGSSRAPPRARVGASQRAASGAPPLSASRSVGSRASGAACRVTCDGQGQRQLDLPVTHGGGRRPGPHVDELPQQRGAACGRGEGDRQQGPGSSPLRGSSQPAIWSASASGHQVDQARAALQRLAAGRSPAPPVGQDQRPRPGVRQGQIERDLHLARRDSPRVKVRPAHGHSAQRLRREHLPRSGLDEPGRRAQRGRLCAAVGQQQVHLASVCPAAPGSAGSPGCCSG